MRVQTSVLVWIDMKRSAVLRIAKCEKEGLCVACLEPIGEERVIRGCHERCAKATYRAITAGLLTDDGQVASGEWLKAARGRKPTNAVSIKAKGTTS